MKKNFHFFVMILTLRALGHTLIAENLEKLYRGIYKTSRETKKRAIKKEFNSLIKIHDELSTSPKVIFMTEEDDWTYIHSSEINEKVRYSDAEIKLTIYHIDMRLEISTFWERSSCSTVGKIPHPLNVYTKIVITIFDEIFEGAERRNNKLECLVPWY